MVIGLDISPVINTGKSQHKLRGVGKYITLLRENLEKYDKENSYIFFDSGSPREVDLIHYPYFDPFFIRVPLIKSKKTIITVHDLIQIKYKNHFPAGIRGSLKWNVNKIILNRANYIIVDSDASANDVKKILGLKEKKISTVYLSCDTNYKPIKKEEDIVRILKKYSLPDNFFLYVGDVTWNKNLPRIVEAIKKIRIPLVMVGKALVDTSYDRDNIWNLDRKKIEEQTRNDPLFYKIGFIENDELNTLYNKAIALCMPSLDEGFGLPVLEALNAGCPVITSKLGSLPEVAGEAALYVDAYDKDSIENGLIKLNNDRKVREKLINKGFLQASKFSLKKMIEDTIAVYKNS